jgi:hypothetical protein
MHARGKRQEARGKSKKKIIDAPMTVIAINN